MKRITSLFKKYQSKDSVLYISAVSLLTVSLVKFFYLSFIVDAPVAYDAGINRFLFLQYSEAFPFLPSLSKWANEHPPGLFYASALFIKLGIPVDWFIGWIWNSFCVFLVATFAFIATKKRNASVGICVLLMAILSRAYYDGFLAMYWKNYAGLFFMILSFYFADKRQWYCLPLAVLSLVMHHATGLLVFMSYGLWWLFLFRDKHISKKRWVFFSATGLVIVALCSGWYLFSNPDFFVYQLKLLFKLTDSPVYGGAFSELSIFLTYAPLVLFFGLFGFAISWKKSFGTIWQCSVLCCLLFILLKLYFYRRFYLQLDFILMFFGAEAIVFLFTWAKQKWMKAILVIAIILQAMVTLAHIHSKKPLLDGRVIELLKDIPSQVEQDAKLLVPENQSSSTVLGWVPSLTVWAPGLYGFDWNQDEWNRFVFGDHADRYERLQTLPSNTYIVITPMFFAMYPQKDANQFINDPCLEIMNNSLLLRIVCK